MRHRTYLNSAVFDPGSTVQCIDAGSVKIVVLWAIQWAKKALKIDPVATVEKTVNRKISKILPKKNPKNGLK